VKSHSETVIFGAGPAGLTAAWELTKNNKQCLVLESDPIFVGGIARTAEYKGYRFDIGGHRFFTKSAEVKHLWHEILNPNDWILNVPRLSRIYYSGKFFAYPLKPFDALLKLGLIKTISSVLSYLKYKVFPIKNPVSFEDWIINNFGKRLYLTFFKSYTEKVWGIPCSTISADWAAQRIKGLSLSGAIKSAFKIPKITKKQKENVIKTLIDKFDYPRLGPGMMWEEATKKINQSGGSVLRDNKVEIINLDLDQKRVISCETVSTNKTTNVYSGQNYISTLPIKNLINSFNPKPPEEIIQSANSLKYRDFLTVVLILDKKESFPDNWIYIHEPDVKLGRVQNFKNWSPEMVPNPDHTSLGLEYFCNEGDSLWSMDDQDLISLGLKEMVKIGLAEESWFLDGTVVRMPKSYPVYDDEYKFHVETVRNWLTENVKNLQLVGRNGMHMYNNQDHSMLAAYLAARNLLGENWDPWKVNADAEYHEEGEDSTISGRLVPKQLQK